MSIRKTQPAETIEGLRTQFFAMKTIIICKEAEIAVYYKRIKELNTERVIQLEAELESQKEMNAILTEELDAYQNQDFYCQDRKHKGLDRCEEQCITCFSKDY